MDSPKSYSELPNSDPKPTPMDSPKSYSELPNSDPKPTPKRRKKNSVVWDHFTIVTINPSCVKASCNHCKKSYAYVSEDKPLGTSHLLRHIDIDTGICSVARREKGQLIPTPSTSRTDISANRSNLQRKRCRAANGVSRVLRTRKKNNSNSSIGCELAKMIIQNDYPLNMVEQTGFLSFARSLNPKFNITSVGLVQEDILGIYKRNKQIIMDILSGIPGGVNLTLDFWTSNQSLDYLLLTGHFIDQDWRLQRRVFSFSLLPSLPNSGTDFNSAIVSCLSDWGLEGKIFTITLDRGYYANRESLRNVLTIKNPYLLKGQLLVNGCYGRLLRSLARDAIGSMQETVQKVRHIVKYIKSSNVHEERFDQLKHILQVPSTKKLVIDDLMRWDTTYLMLTAACEVKQVFSCIDTSDSDYKSTPCITPCMEEWRQIETLCSVLKIFYTAVCELTSESYPTANLLFLEASHIRLELMHGAWSHDLLLSTLVKPLHEKYTKYWEDNYLMLAIAGILDPRLKVELVDMKFKNMYGKDAEEWTAALRTSLSQLFSEYEKMMYAEMNEDNLVKTDILLAEGDNLWNIDLDMSDVMGETHVKHEFEDVFLENPVFHPNFESVFHGRSEMELDRYLEDPIVPNVQGFDIMGWWKTYGLNYPVLSRMACDVLSVPFCTVPLESIFDMRGRRLDSYQSSLCGKTLEAMVCAKDWLRYDENAAGSTVTSEA